VTIFSAPQEGNHNQPDRRDQEQGQVMGASQLMHDFLAERRIAVERMGEGVLRGGNKRRQKYKCAHDSISLLSVVDGGQARLTAGKFKA
jgi:hypothetical protein